MRNDWSSICMLRAEFANVLCVTLDIRIVLSSLRYRNASFVEQMNWLRLG